MKVIEHHLPDLVLVEHVFRVPLDHEAPRGSTLEVFAREVRAVGRPESPQSEPWILFLQGGPGFAANRPTQRSGWIEKALSTGHRVLLLDQRGTGRSSPVSHRTLECVGDARAQAEYLRHFRADSIVRDAELVRRELLGPEGRWKVLGQSFGGFCLATYLSQTPEHLDAGFFTGGLPKLDAHADDVYRLTYPACAEKTRRFYRRYPEDEQRMNDLARHVAEHDVRLPNGERLTARRLQQLGMLLGVGDGLELLHYLLEDAFVLGPDGLEPSMTFLRGFENALHWDTNPLYSVLHEACYAQGAATEWSAWRIREEFAEFALVPGERMLLTGEMISPWMFEEIGPLRPLAAVAERIAAAEDWPALYDRARLAANTVPCAAAIYLNDMYVPLEFSRETARGIRGLKTWETADFEHNGLRADGERVFGKLLDLLRP